MLTTTPRALQTAIAHAYQHTRERPIMVWGPPGSSKTASVALVAEQLGIQHRDLRLGNLTPSDLKGLPVIDHDERVTRYYPPDELPRDGNGILTLDEINVAAPVMQALAQELLLERRLGTYRLPSGWLIVGMGNRKEDRAAVHAMPAPAANRFKHYALEPSLSDWTYWAQATNSIHEHIIAFLHWRPELLHRFDPNSPSWPSPRSWHIASDDYRTGGSVIPAVGEGPGLEFEAYREVYAHLPDLDQIVNDPNASVTAPSEASALYALTLGLADRIDTPERATNGLTWVLEHLTDEFTQLYLASAKNTAQARGTYATLAAAFSTVDGALEHLTRLEELSR